MQLLRRDIETKRLLRNTEQLELALDDQQLVHAALRQQVSPPPAAFGTRQGKRAQHSRHTPTVELPALCSVQRAGYSSVGSVLTFHLGLSLARAATKPSRAAAAACDSTRQRHVSDACAHMYTDARHHSCRTRNEQGKTMRSMQHRATRNAET
jgi:hypothetical protein